MGGIGKSWRRVWHEKFMPSYKTRAIGCHWEGEWINDDAEYQTHKIASIAELTSFLTELRQFCCEYAENLPDGNLDWKEAWHPQRVQVYTKEVNNSRLIDLFHDDTFKTTPAIGGRKPNEKRPTSVSCVWHRMLPIELESGDRYLEIITLFTSNKNSWLREREDRLQPFISAIQSRGFTRVIWDEPKREIAFNRSKSIKPKLKSPTKKQR